VAGSGEAYARSIREKRSAADALAAQETERDMAYALRTPTIERARPTVIAPLSIEAELSCMMCGRIVGDVVNGRVVQHAGCPNELRVNHGLIRCCHCNGPVYREPMMALSAR
jgi:hypothetical protein